MSMDNCTVVWVQIVTIPNEKKETGNSNSTMTIDDPFLLASGVVTCCNILGAKEILPVRTCPLFHVAYG